MYICDLETEVSTSLNFFFFGFWKWQKTMKALRTLKWEMNSLTLSLKRMDPYKQMGPTLQQIGQIKSNLSLGAVSIIQVCQRLDNSKKLLSKKPELIRNERSHTTTLSTQLLIRLSGSRAFLNWYSLLSIEGVISLVRSWKSESHRVNRVSSTKAMVCIIEAKHTAGTVGAVCLQATTKCCVSLQPSVKAVVTSF